MWPRQCSRFDFINLFPAPLALGGLQPYIIPITISYSRTDSCTNGLEHVLRWVNTGRAHSPVTRKIFTDGLRVLANITKINCLPPFLKEQKSVEALEQERRRLVDGAKNSLTLVGELTQETNQVPRAEERPLAVAGRRRVAIPLRIQS